MLKFEMIHEDERGEIYLITGALPEGRELTLFTTKKGFARGGCIHKESAEDCIIIKGEIQYFIEGWDPAFMSRGDTCHISSNTPHYFIALTEETIVMEWGPKPGEKTEKYPEWRETVDGINQSRLS